MCSEDAIENSLFKGMAIGNHHLQISNFFYVDDEIFLVDWNVDNVRILIHILRIFFMVSELQINLHKSKLYEIIVSYFECSQVASCMRCASNTMPSVYLGLPVRERMYRVASWDALIDKFTKYFLYGILRCFLLEGDLLWLSLCLEF